MPISSNTQDIQETRVLTSLAGATGLFDGEVVFVEGIQWVWSGVWTSRFATYQFGLNGTSTTGELRSINGMGLSNSNGWALSFPVHVRSVSISCESSTGNGILLEVRSAQMNGTAPTIDATTPLSLQGNRSAFREFAPGELVIPVSRRFHCGFGGTIGTETATDPQGCIEIWREFQ